ncbi:Uncharacterised protein [Vibrio cholerae]|nr:Uncharacterised protein [Vibrio cholerae]
MPVGQAVTATIFMEIPHCYFCGDSNIALGKYSVFGQDPVHSSNRMLH